MSRRSSSANAALTGTAPLFAALGDETRLQIVARLCAEGPLSIVSLSEGASVTRQAVTKHLQALADVGLVRPTSPGQKRRRIWQLAPRRLDEARRQLERISQQWDQAIDRLKALVEE
jgi:DNA-binding transcriptional ArsR family regulator